MVGASGFEPETFCTPSKRATSLRYAPMGEKCPQNVATFPRFVKHKGSSFNDLRNSLEHDASCS